MRAVSVVFVCAFALLGGAAPACAEEGNLLAQAGPIRHPPKTPPPPPPPDHGGKPPKQAPKPNIGHPGPNSPLPPNKPGPSKN